MRHEGVCFGVSGDAQGGVRDEIWNLRGSCYFICISARRLSVYLDLPRTEQVGMVHKLDHVWRAKLRRHTLTESRPLNAPVPAMTT